MTDPTHHSVVARSLLVEAVPALVGQTEEYVDTRPLATAKDSDDTAAPTTTQSREQE
jgi:hypothetical protein